MTFGFFVASFKPIDLKSKKVYSVLTILAILFSR